MKVTLYGNTTCPYCGAARMLLTRKSIAFEDIGIAGNHELRNEMLRRSGSSQVPQVFIDDRHVGGFDELSALDASGELDKLLAG